MGYFFAFLFWESLPALVMLCFIAWFVSRTISRHIQVDKGHRLVVTMLAAPVCFGFGTLLFAFAGHTWGTNLHSICGSEDDYWGIYWAAPILTSEIWVPVIYAYSNKVEPSADGDMQS